MGAKTGKGMLLYMLYSGGLVVAHVAGDCSLAARRVNVPCQERIFVQKKKELDAFSRCTVF